MSIILYGKQPSSKGKGHLINSTSQSMRLCNPSSSESSTSIPHSTFMIAKSIHIYVISHTNEIVHLILQRICSSTSGKSPFIFSFFIYLLYLGLINYYKLVWFYWTISLFCCFFLSIITFYFLNFLLLYF